MVELTSALTTTLIGMFGVVIGAIISNYVNQKIASRSARYDLIFRKKIEYFDRMVGAIEHNLKLYTLWRRKLEVKCNSAIVVKALKDLKKNRKHFDISTSALYLDVEVFSPAIKSFVAVEKQVFALFDRLKKDDPESVLDTLRGVLYRLSLVGRDVVSRMRAQLVKE